MHIIVSWLIALVVYIIAVPANRLGAASGMNVAQLKIIQEVVTVCVFVPFMILFMGEKWRWDYLWAFLCMVGAVYFVNRAKLSPLSRIFEGAVKRPRARSRRGRRSGREARQQLRQVGRLAFSRPA